MKSPAQRGDSSAERPLVLLCFAVKQEASFFAAPEAISAEVRTLVTGIGPRNAAKAIEQAIESSHPELVLTCGFAGALDPDLALGSIVFSADAETGLDQILRDLGAAPVEFHCSDRIAARAAEKRGLWERTSAAAVEMESGVIRQICRAHRIPAATVRSISDTAQEDLPLDFNALLKPDCQIDLRKLVWSLMMRPGKILALMSFQRRVNKAARRLGETLRELLRRKYLLSR